MANEKKSFSELLNEAPLAVDEKIITITGVLSRSNERGKFVLRTSDNQTLTLDVDAVKGYQVLSGMIGQTIVQVELDRDSIPASYVGVSPGYPGQFTSIFGDVSTPVGDITFGETSIEFPYQWYSGYQNYGGVPGPFAGVAPFALATPHQAPVNSPDYIRVTHPIYAEWMPAHPTNAIADNPR